LTKEGLALINGRSLTAILRWRSRPEQLVARGGYRRRCRSTPSGLHYPSKRASRGGPFPQVASAANIERLMPAAR